MENTPKNIGDLFKTQLDDFSVEGSADEWIGLDMKLDKMSFFKFHLSHFNIYYAGLIGICISLSSAVFIDHFMLRDNTKERKPITTNADKNYTPIEKKPSFITTEKAAPKKSQENKQQLPQHKKQERVLIEKSNTNTTVIQDVLQTTIPKDITNEETVEIPITKEAIKPTKKVVYITQKDTTIVYDTLTVKKRKHK